MGCNALGLSVWMVPFARRKDAVRSKARQRIIDDYTRSSRNGELLDLLLRGCTPVIALLVLGWLASASTWTATGEHMIAGRGRGLARDSQQRPRVVASTPTNQFR
jgi:hypothetical protein